MANTWPSILGLPRELRDMVLTHLLVVPADLIEVPCVFLSRTRNRSTDGIQAPDHHSGSADHSIASHVTLSLTSRQLRAEAMPIFFGGNTFGAWLSSCNSRLPLAGIPGSALGYVRHLALYRFDRHSPAGRGVFCVLDLRIRGNGDVAWEVVARKDGFMSETLGMLYRGCGAGGGFEGWTEREEEKEARVSAVKRVEPVVEKLREQLGRSGDAGMTRVSLEDLAEGMFRAW